MNRSDADGLPRGWATAQLGDLGDWSGGGTPSKSNPSFWRNASIPWVSPKDMKSFEIHDTEDHITAAAIDSSATTLLPAGAVLMVTRSGILRHTFPVSVARVPVTLNQDLKALTPAPGICPDYLTHALRAFGQSILHSCTKDGTTVQSIESPVLKAFSIPIAPTAEQTRIADALDELFSDLDAGVAALERVREKLKHYRASVLKAAVEGALTARTSAPRRPLAELIGEIGQGWSPRCDLNRTAREDEWAIIKTTAVQSMRYLDNENKALPSNLNPRPQFEIQPGDMLMTRKGPRQRAGVACLVRATRKRLMVCDTVYRFRCNDDVVLPAFLELALNSPSIFAAIDKLKSGISDSGVSLTHEKLYSVAIPVPGSKREQAAIVDLVEDQVSVIDHLESDIATKLKEAQSLRQSILRHAFAGKLVPQDPKDEPASELLKRIAAEREQRARQEQSTRRARPGRPRKAKQS